MVNLICGWCNKPFEAKIQRAKSKERTHLICPNCGRTLPSSRKESTGKSVGKKHIHIDYKDGDRV